MEKMIKKGQYRKAEVTLPPSKSLSHRVVIAAALADGVSTIANLGDSKDITATKDALRHLGITFTEGDILRVEGKAQWALDGQIVDCNESGSTLRFLIPIFSLRPDLTTFTGRGRLMERPQNVYQQLWRERGLMFTQKDAFLRVQGPLRAGTFTMDGNVSSQFVSGLLFALPLCEGDSKIVVRKPFESSSYVGLTLDVLAKAGIEIDTDGYTFYIKGGQHYHPAHYVVPGDDSQMVFFAACALLYGIPVDILGADQHSKQGDHVLLEHMQAFGGKVAPIRGGYRISPGEHHGACIDLGDCPDLGPMLFALASQMPGKTVFKHCMRLRMKESDRIECMEEELRKLGCQITSHGGTVTVEGKPGIISGQVLDGHNDHRIVMALSVLAGIGEGTRITGAEAITKSYPGFFEDLAKIGVEIC